jgi:hypothetical protein
VDVLTNYPWSEKFQTSQLSHPVVTATLVPIASVTAMVVIEVEYGDVRLRGNLAFIVRRNPSNPLWPTTAAIDSLSLSQKLD